MDKCGNCLKPAVQLFETGKDGVYHCFKCQPLVPEVTIGDNTPDSPEHEPEAQSSNNEESAQLHTHLRNHRAERRFVCTYCNKAFSQSNNLRAHLRIHTNERPYKCSECGKAFTQVTNLNNHVRLHTGERPYVCPEPGCSKAYAQVTNLNQHRKRHLSGRPVESTYDCTVCGERFSQRNHMYTHRREAHAELKSAVQTRSGGAAAAGGGGGGGGGGAGGRRRGEGGVPCRLCSARLPSERQLHLHLARHHAADDDAKSDESGSGASSSGAGAGAGSFACVFRSCGARVSSPRAHTEHLLRAHQLRVLAPARPAPRRGRPPKAAPAHMLTDLKDPLDISDHTDYDEVKIVKEEAQYVPKLKVQSLFQ